MGNRGGEGGDGSREDGMGEYGVLEFVYCVLCGVEDRKVGTMIGARICWCLLVFVEWSRMMRCYNLGGTCFGPCHLRGDL